MRASPAIHVSVSRFGLWRGAIGALAMAAVGTIVLWLFGRDPPAAASTQAIVGVALCAVIGLAISLARVPHVGLRWDGQAWHLSGTGNSTAETPGEVTVAIDLGAWMLLRFKPAAHTGFLQARWLPVQRRGLEGPWHGLRCALYSPRPKPGAEGVPP